MVFGCSPDSEQCVVSKGHAGMLTWTEESATRCHCHWPSYKALEHNPVSNVRVLQFESCRDFAEGMRKAGNGSGSSRTVSAAIYIRDRLDVQTGLVKIPRAFAMSMGLEDRKEFDGISPGWVRKPFDNSL